MEHRSSYYLYFMAFAAGSVLMQSLASDEHSSLENTTENISSPQFTTTGEALTPTLQNIPLEIETQLAVNVPVLKSEPPQPTATGSVAGSDDITSHSQPPAKVEPSSRFYIGIQEIIIPSDVHVNDNLESSNYITSSQILPSMVTVEHGASEDTRGTMSSQFRDITSAGALELLKTSVVTRIPPPESLLHVSPTPESLLHVSPTPESLLHVSPTPESLLHVSPTPESLLHVSPTPSPSITMESKSENLNELASSRSYSEEAALTGSLVGGVLTPSALSDGIVSDDVVIPVLSSSWPLVSQAAQVTSSLETSQILMSEVLPTYSTQLPSLTKTMSASLALKSSVSDLPVSLPTSEAIIPSSTFSLPTEASTLPLIGQNVSENVTLSVGLYSTIGYENTNSTALSSASGYGNKTSVVALNSTQGYKDMSSLALNSTVGFSDMSSKTTDSNMSSSERILYNVTESGFTMSTNTSAIVHVTEALEATTPYVDKENATEFIVGIEVHNQTESYVITNMTLPTTMTTGGSSENSTHPSDIIVNSPTDDASSISSERWNESVVTSTHSTLEGNFTTSVGVISIIPGFDQNDTSNENVTTIPPGFNDTDEKPVFSKPTSKPPTSTKNPLDGNEILKTDKVPVATILTSHMSGPPKTTVPLTPPSNNLEPVVKPTDKVLPTVYISLTLKMSWSEFCPHFEAFQAVITKLLVNHKKQVISPNQVEIMDDTKCFGRGIYTRYHRLPKSVDISIAFYIVDPKGTYDEELTNMVADLLDDEQLLLNELQGTVFHGKVLMVKVYGNRQEEGGNMGSESQEQAIGVGITVGIIIATLVGLCVIGFVIFQIAVMRKRRGVKKMRYSYNNSRYSLDVHSIHEAIQLTGVSRREDRFAYINPGLVADDKDLSSNSLTMEGLDNMLKNIEIIEDEFLMLPNIIPKLTDVPEGAEDKNRYANVIPIPETRVVLNKETGEDGGDYINANFVRGHLCCPESYIATQAPMEHTKGDFWQMVWDQQSQVIIMLTTLEEHGLSKCAEYWPNTVGGDIVRVYDYFEVTKRKREVKAEWILSILRLKNLKLKQTRDVVHFWLTAWPIDGMPDCKTVINFLLEARPYMEYGAGPTVVHCSPGNGRTGTLLATDIQMLSYDDTKMVDILSCLHRLREDRAGAVQTKEQYMFIYKVLHEYAKMLNSRHTSNASSVASINITS